LAIYWRSILAGLGGEDRLLAARDAGGRLTGIAAWVAPGAYPQPAPVQARQALGALRALVPRPPALVRGSKYLLAIDKVHPKEHLWYLELLVVDPSMQRSGIGGRLQAEVMAEADEDGLDCYLETQNSDNLPYYARFGYEVADELHPVRSGPPLWTMRRKARRHA
jgi:GNAT superfamily N-acetyltransferase